MSDGGTRPIWIDAMLSLRGEGYRVWSYLYWRQGSNGYAWPSQEGIAEDLGLSVRYIKRVLKELEAGGWLAVEWPCGPGRGQAHTKRYTVTCPEKGNCSSPIEGEKRGTTDHLLDPEKGNDGSPIGPKRGTVDPPKRGTVDPPNTIHGTLSKKEKKREGPAARSRTPFVPPTVQQVEEFGREIGYQINGVKFVSNYESKGWKVGKTPMKNWQAAVRTWQQGDLRRQQKGFANDRQKSAPLRDDYDYGDDLVDIRTGAKVPGVRS